MPQELHSGRLPHHLWPILLVAYSCLLPPELTFTVQDAALFPYRLALIVSLPFAIARLAQSPVRPSIIDVFAAFSSIWFVLSLTITTSFEAGLVSGGSYAIDYGFAYLLGRASMRSAEDFRLFFRYLLPGILVTVAILAAESLSHRMLLRPYLAQLLGQPEPDIYFRFRFGLLRAMGPFPHPILSGVYLAGTLPLAWYLGHNPRYRLLGCAAAMGAIFTVSSTAVIGMATGFILIAMDMAQRLSRMPVFPLAGIAIVLMLTVISVVSETGLISFAIRNFTFDVSSGFYRMWIWEYGGAEALANPWFGIGLRDWVRPEGMISESVDAYWLLVTMMHGFPVLVSLAMVMLGTLFAIMMTQRFRHPADQDVGKAIMVFIVIAIISGFTVHFWQQINTWLALVAGAGLSLASQARFVPQPQWHQPTTGHAPFGAVPAAAE